MNFTTRLRLFEKVHQCSFYFLIFWSLIFVIAAQKLRHALLINESLKS